MNNNRKITGKQWRSAVLSKHCTLHPSIKITLIAIAEFMFGDKDYAFPTQQGLSDLTGTPVKTIERHISDALKSGWLFREQKKFNEKGSGWRRNVYYTSVPEQSRTLMGEGSIQVVPSSDEVVPSSVDNRTLMGEGLILNRSNPQVESSSKKQDKPQVSLVSLKDQGDASLVNVIKDEATVVLGLGPQETANVIQHSPSSSGDTVIKLETTGNKHTLVSSNGSLASPEGSGAVNGPKQTLTTLTSPEGSEAILENPAPTPHLRFAPPSPPKTFGRWRTNQPPLTKKYFDSMNDPVDRWNFIQSRNGQELFCDFKPQDRKTLELVVQMKAHS